MAWRNRVVAALLGLILVAAIAWGLMPRPVPVEVRPVARGALVVTVEEEGRTRVVDRFVVSAPVAGYARRVELEVADRVEQGQGLVTLEPLRSEVLDPRRRAAAEARVEAARSALEATRQNAQGAAAEAEIAALEYRRRKALCERDCVSREERDQAEAEMRRTAAARRSAEFAVDVARFELDAARTALEHSAAREAGEVPEQVNVRAPVAGQVLRVHRKSEGVVAAGEALVEIGDLRALEVEVDLLSADAVRVAPGTRVRLERWGGPPLAGVVRVVEPTGFTKISALGVEEQRALVIVDITSPHAQWARLGDGYSVEASFVLWEGADVTQVPASALFRAGDGWAVFVVDGGRARERAVEVGQRTGFAAEIRSGLAPGERVIVHPGGALADGLRVRVRGGSD